MKKFFLLVLMTVHYVFAADMQKFLQTNPSIEQIHTGLNQHEFSCKELINGYLERIKLYNLSTNSNHAPLNAITQLNPQALVIADGLDEELAKNKVFTGSLWCIPVIVKDNIDVAGLRTSSGSLTLLGTYPLMDAVIIRKIKGQGGIILAKSAMDEMASGLSGISSLSGRIGNAYNTAYNPGGSSGGSAVSVAANFAPLAIGSDNSGSVRVPAAYNGIYGLRPTYGLISHAGIFPLGNLDGTAGPMANNVPDLAQLLTIMAANKVDYSEYLNADSLVGKHFAMIKSVAGKSLFIGMPQSILAIYNKVKDNLQSQGATISEIDLPRFSLERKNNMAGTIEEINGYLTQNISNISGFDAICQGKSRVYGTPKNCMKLIIGIKSKNSPEFQQVTQIIAKNQAYILGIMQQQHLDGLILPSGKSGIASYDGNQIGDQSVIASNSGLPEITLPVAQYKGLPVGLELLGPKYAESALLSYAFAYQKHFYSFKAPNLLLAPQFKNWSINELNTLYLLIGKISFTTVIEPMNQNKISPEQSIIATHKAIMLIKTVIR